MRAIARCLAAFSLLLTIGAGVAAAQPADQMAAHKRYKEAGMTMPLLWPPFRDVPTSKTIDDIKRLVEEIMPKVNAA